MKRILQIAVLTVVAAQPALAATEKVTVCHKGTDTLSIAQSAVRAHTNHGDALGACPVIEPTPAAVALMRCDSVAGNMVVVAVSASDQGAGAGGTARSCRWQLCHGCSGPAEQRLAAEVRHLGLGGGTRRGRIRLRDRIHLRHHAAASASRSVRRQQQRPNSSPAAPRVAGLAVPLFVQTRHAERRARIWQGATSRAVGRLWKI